MVSSLGRAIDESPSDSGDVARQLLASAALFTLHARAAAGGRNGPRSSVAPTFLQIFLDDALERFVDTLLPREDQLYFWRRGRDSNPR